MDQTGDPGRQQPHAESCRGAQMLSVRLSDGGGMRGQQRQPFHV